MTSDLSSSLQVATWNVFLGADLEPMLHAVDEASLDKLTRAVAEQAERTRFPERVEVIADVIGQEAPDVVGLQELARWFVETPDGRETLWDHEDLVIAALERRGHPYVMLHCSETFTGAVRLDGDRWLRFVSCDAMLLRAAPEREITVHDADHGHFDARWDARLPGLEEPIEVKRGWVQADLEVDGRRTRVVSTHLAPHDEDLRLRQAHELVSVVSTSPYPVVLVGDLNDEPGSATLDVLTHAGYLDAWAACGAGDGFTWGGTPDLDGERDLRSRLDYVLIDPAEASIGSVRLLGDATAARTRGAPPLWPSDHVGVVAEVCLP